MKENNIKVETPKKAVDDKAKKDALKKQKQRAETNKFKSKYFEYYDDIKISDRQDW